jgi:hypothetical protein
VFPSGRLQAKLKLMRCQICAQRARWWRRRCDECSRLAAVFAAHRGADMGTMMELFIASHEPPDKVERFLLADIDGGGAVRDQIAADMTNDLLRAFGHTAQQTPRQVERIRARGTWMTLGRRPPE